MENNVFKDWIEKTSGGSEYATFFNMLKIYMSKTDTQAGYDITGVPVYVSDVTFEDNTFTFTFSDGSVLVSKVEGGGSSVDSYTKSESDEKFSLKTEVYTKNEIDSKIPSQIEIVNNLTSGGTTKALSAEQGKVLKSNINSSSTELKNSVGLTSTGILPDLTNTNYLSGSSTIIDGLKKLDIQLNPLIIPAAAFNISSSASSDEIGGIFTEELLNDISNNSTQNRYVIVVDKNTNFYQEFPTSIQYSNNSGNITLRLMYTHNGTLFSREFKRTSGVWSISSASAGRMIISSDIVNNTTDGGSSKVLSAEQGKQLNLSLNSKVDKVVGKSLISDSEITRLASVTNYDDTDLVAELNKKANTDNVYSKTDIDGKLVVATTSKDGLMSSSDKTKLNGIDLSNYVSMSTYNSKVSELESTISELTTRLEALESK